MTDNRGTTRTIGFNRHNLDLLDYAEKLVKEKGIDLSAAVMLCIREHKNNKISTRELIETLMQKIDNLSLTSIPIEQSEQIKEEVKKKVFDFGDNPFGEN